MPAYLDVSAFLCGGSEDTGLWGELEFKFLQNRRVLGFIARWNFGEDAGNNAVWLLLWLDADLGNKCSVELDSSEEPYAFWKVWDEPKANLEADR